MRLDRLIIRERNNKCKRLKRLRKARDVASKYVKYKLPLSKVYGKYRFVRNDERMFLPSLVKDIVDCHRSILGLDRPPAPPVPPSRKVTAKK